MGAPTWRHVPGNPWRRTRLGAVVGAPGGVALLDGPTAVVFGLLPATTDELVAALGANVDEVALLAALAELADNGLVAEA